MGAKLGQHGFTKINKWKFDYCTLQITLLIIKGDCPERRELLFVSTQNFIMNF